MIVIEAIEEMQRRSHSLKASGATISLVPTMGFLHEGHLELLRVAKRHSDRVIMSLFVNPTQFGPSEDYEDYPRDREGDLAKAEEEGVDTVFSPTVEEMYPEGFQTSVKVKNLTQRLCGLSRPGHFDGVTLVVLKLFNITGPHLAIFGQKDYQQLTVISRMAMDLNLDIKIVGVPTVREADGLAMSSRNKYLGPEERKSALSLKKSLDLAERMFEKGETHSSVIVSEVEKLILSHPGTDIDYVEICDPVTLEHISTLGDENLFALAVQIGKARLIDNCLLRRGRE